MKKTLLLLFISIQAYAQVDVEHAQINLSEATLSFSSSAERFVRNALYSQNGTEVKAVLTTSITGSVYWRRNVGGVITNGVINLNEPIYNGDIVVGNGGNQILVVYQGGSVGFEGIRYASYSLAGATYVQTAIGNLALNFNSGGTGMLYGGPAVVVDQNDSVVVMYKSFNTSVVTSNEIHFFSRAGDLNGNWKNYPNVFNAFIVDQGLSLPLQYDALSGDVGLTKYSNNNSVNFALPVSSGGFSLLYLQQISFSDLSSGSSGGLTSKLLKKISGSKLIRKVSIDGAPVAFEPNITDDWILAMNQIVGTKNDINVFKGKAGSFISQPFLKPQLGLVKQAVSPDIQYFNDLVSLVFLNNDDPCKDVQDPLNVFINNFDGSLTSPSFCRLNTEQYIFDNQTSVSLSTPSSTELNAYVSFFDPVSQEIVESDIFSCEYCQTIEVQEEESNKTQVNKTEVDGDKLYVLIHDLTGRLLFRVEGGIIPSMPISGIYIVSTFFENGEVIREKTFLK